MFSFQQPESISGAAVLILTHEKGKRGVMMYPVDTGTFNSEEDQREYEDLFVDKAPKIPYSGVGCRYAEKRFDTEQLREAKLEHMNTQGIVPKETSEQFWAKDDLALNKITFSVSAPVGGRETFYEITESPLECARRILWQYGGTRIIDDEEFILVGYYTAEEKTLAVYAVRISYEKLMDDWICHQSERQTLTDWTKCPHTEILNLLGIDDVVKASYCTTHSGPVFVTELNKRIDPVTLDIMKKCPIPLKNGDA